MSEEDLKLVLAKYQQKTFELFNQNIVLETQVEKLTSVVNSMNIEIEKMCNKLNAKKMTYASYYSDKLTYLNIISNNTEYSGDEILQKYNSLRNKYSSHKLKHIIDKIVVS